MTKQFKKWYINRFKYKWVDRYCAIMKFLTGLDIHIHCFFDLVSSACSGKIGNPYSTWTRIHQCRCGDTLISNKRQKQDPQAVPRQHGLTNGSTYKITMPIK